MTSVKSLTTETRLNALVALLMPEPWNTGTLPGGWTGTFKYRKIGNSQVQVKGQFIAGMTNQLAAQNFWTPPAGYFPASQQALGPLEVNWNSGYANGTILPPRLIINTSSWAQITNIGGTSLFFDLTYSLDF